MPKSMLDWKSRLMVSLAVDDIYNRREVKRMQTCYLKYEGKPSRSVYRDHYPLTIPCSLCKGGEGSALESSLMRFFDSATGV